MTVDSKMLETAKYHRNQGRYDRALKAIDSCMRQTKRPSIKLAAAKFSIQYEKEMRIAELQAEREANDGKQKHIRVSFH